MKYILLKIVCKFIKILLITIKKLLVTFIAQVVLDNNPNYLENTDISEEFAGNKV